MAFGKWIGGVLGFTQGGILGAIAGFALGAFFDSLSNTDTSEGVFSTPSDDDGIDGASRNRFLFSLMVVSAHVIQADGRIMHSEMEYVRRFLLQNFGEDAKHEGNEILLRIFEYRKQHGEAKWNKDIDDVCREIYMRMPIEHRTQLISMLIEIANADGQLQENERYAIRHIAVLLGISENVVSQMMSLGKKNIDDAYKVFGVSSDATEEELRRTYRKLALQYHPDRVASLGEDIKENAKRRFQELNEAKEIIWKERNIK